MSPLVYIIVLNYCSLDDTLNCIGAIRKIEYQNYRLLVIDNSSPDSSGDTLAKKLPPHEFLRLPHNTGYAGGNNAGFDIALSGGGSYVLVVNPDVILPSNSLSEYVAILEADPRIGALNPIQLDGSGAVDVGFSRAVLSAATPNIDTKSEGLHETQTLFGAALMLPTATLRSVGGFDPLFFAYGEEEDLCRRIRARGLKLVVTREAPVTHHRSKAKNGVSDFVLFLRLKGSYLFNLKNPQLGFRYALKHFARDLSMDLIGKRKTSYPFNTYPIKRSHILKAAWWVLRNIEAIRQHRKLDKSEGPFIP